MIQTLKRGTFRLFILGHLALVLAVVTHANDLLKGFPLVDAVINYYSAFTYCNRNFGFFAPDVAGDLNLKMTGYTADGKAQDLKFVLPNREFEVRMYSMKGHFAEDQQEATMDLFARSWAVKCMNDLSHIKRVDVYVDQNVLPSMSDFRQGKRIEHEFLYSTTIEK